MRHLVIMKAPSFVVAVLLAVVAIAASWFLGLNILSFTLISLILVLISILLIRIIFKNGHNLASWFKSERPDNGSGYGLIAKVAITVKTAARGYYYSRTEIAGVLRTALALRFGGQSDGRYWRSVSTENAREDLTLLVGKNPRVLEIFDPREEEGHRRRFAMRSSREEEEYLSSLEEAIRIVNERGT